MYCYMCALTRLGNANRTKKTRAQICELTNNVQFIYLLCHREIKINCPAVMHTTYLYYYYCCTKDTNTIDFIVDSWSFAPTYGGMHAVAIVLPPIVAVHVFSCAKNHSNWNGFSRKRLHQLLRIFAKYSGWKRRI